MKHVLGFGTKLHGHTLIAPRRLSKMVLCVLVLSIAAGFLV